MEYIVHGSQKAPSIVLLLGKEHSCMVISYIQKYCRHKIKK
jgi:hypothetical protein